MKCEDCKKEIINYKFDTAFGVLCQECFCKRLGEEIEKHPIGGHLFVSPKVSQEKTK